MIYYSKQLFISDIESEAKVQHIGQLILYHLYVRQHNDKKYNPEDNNMFTFSRDLSYYGTHLLRCKISTRRKGTITRIFKVVGVWKNTLLVSKLCIIGLIKEHSLWDLLLYWAIMLLYTFCKKPCWYRYCQELCAKKFADSGWMKSSGNRDVVQSRL